MADDHAERLSALMDAELPQARATRALDQLLADESMRKTWGRYHLIGAALRDELGPVDPALAERVRRAVAAEPVSLKPGVRPARRLVSAPRRVALAACLVLAVAAGAYVVPWTAEQAAAPVAELDAAPGAVPVLAAAATPVAPLRPQVDLAAAALEDAGTVRWGGHLRPATARHLNNLLVNHNERGAMTGMHPYARLVVYETSYR